MRIATLVAAGALTATAATAQDLPQAGNDWFTAGQAAVEAGLAKTPIVGRAKNIILFISDGNGVGSNTATRIWMGQQAGGFGEEHVLPFETFPYLALSKTYNVNAQTPDSAGTGTAMQSGVKTKAGVIGVDETLNRGDCSQVAGATVATIGEIAAAAGKSVGVVSTARITHATPASSYAHSADRNFEDDSKLPEGCAHKDIAAQLLDAMAAGTIDIALGGGRRHFLPKEAEDQEGKNGRRTDGRDLIAEAAEAGAQFAWDDETFATLDLAADAPVLGLFESSHMKYEHDREGEPSLAEMTRAAIEYLQKDEDGFYLMVEAGRVDHASHAGNLHRMVTDGAAFAEAVAVAMELTDEQDTLIIVTADHEHAIAFHGYCGRGAPITGLCYDIDRNGVKHTDEPLLGADGKPYTVVGFLNGPGSVLIEQPGGEHFGSRPVVTQEQATDPEYLQQALVPKSSETHSGEDVAIYARGPFAHLVSGTLEQNVIFHIMHHAMTAE